MKTSDFVELVAKLRMKQRAYFRGQKELMAECKTLEREVDHAISQYQSKQQALFEENNGQS